MKAVIQRVTFASVNVEGKIVSEIEKGLLVLLGISPSDGEADIQWLSKKIANLRIFNDDHQVMNLSVKDVEGDILVVSQFTLMANTKKGNRPSYVNAAVPEIAIPLYEDFCRELETQLSKPVGKGIFGADMKVQLLNDGPVTIVLDTANK